MYMDICTCTPNANEYINAYTYCVKKKELGKTMACTVHHPHIHAGIVYVH